MRASHPPPLSLDPRIPRIESPSTQARPRPGEFFRPWGAPLLGSVLRSSSEVDGFRVGIPTSKREPEAGEADAIPPRSARVAAQSQCQKNGTQRTTSPPRRASPHATTPLPICRAASRREAPSRARGRDFPIVVCHRRALVGERHPQLSGESHGTSPSLTLPLRSRAPHRALSSPGWFPVSQPKTSSRSSLVKLISSAASFIVATPAISYSAVLRFVRQVSR